MYQSNVHTLNVRLAEARCTEMAGEKLQQSKVGRYQIVDVLLPFRQSFLVSSSKFLFAKERVWVPLRKSADASKGNPGHIPQGRAEEPTFLSHSVFPIFCDCNKDAGFHPWILFCHTCP